MSVEFRNAPRWNERNRASTLAFEREHELVNVVVGGPQGVGNSVPPVWEVTSRRLAVVRMHGRDHQTWNRKGLKAASDRFNYDYSWWSYFPCGLVRFGVKKPLHDKHLRFTQCVGRRVA